jgi:hypothetical protein
MNRILTKTVIAILAVTMMVGGIIFYACQKENNVLNSDKTELIKQTKVEANINPFDYVGVWHNQYLDYMQTYPEFDNLTNKEDFFNYGTTFFSTISSEMSADYFSYSQYLAIEEGIDSLMMYENGTDVANAICTKLSECPAIHSYIHILYEDILYSESVFNTVTSDCCSPDVFHAKIDNLVQIILNENSDISVNSPAGYMLAACAIADHSYDYWYNYFIIDNKIYPPLVNCIDPGKHPRLARFIESARAFVHKMAVDVGGFFGGYTYNDTEGHVVTLRSIPAAAESSANN